MDLEGNDIQVPVAKWNRRSEKCGLKGPLRVVRLCLLAICLPGALVAVPLYLRYRVYSEQTVPLGMSDMRLLDNKISTTWCQSQLIRSNATFNAYLVPEKPPVRPDPMYVTMVREIVLEDDMKEYWGFYLLKGSTVTVSTCCRRPGASLIVIKGHRHLRACTYIGDDSSEEEEELAEINEATAANDTKPLSIPVAMQRARPDILFNGNDHRNSSERKLISKALDLKDTGDDVDLDLVVAHNHKMKHPLKAVGEISRLHHLSHEQQHHHGNKSNRFFHDGINRVDSRASEEVFKAVEKKFKSYEKQGKDVMQELKLKLGTNKRGDTWKWLRQLVEEHENILKINETEASSNQRHTRNIGNLQRVLSQHDEEGNNAEEEGVEHQEVRGTINGTTANDTSNSEFWSSFSSSEERLLECEGLILSQALVPSPFCQKSHSRDELDRTCKRQQFTYTVPGNGYYFFVFSSENEVQPNYIRAHFQLEKLVYNVSNSVAACENSTGQCSLPLNFFSKEKLVLELPVNDSLWNTEFLIVSTCEPRTMIYAMCIIAVPVLILLCAY